MSSNPDVPPFTGYVETTVNALRLIHAARQGVIPRITRRLNDSERRSMIKSGAVFVFSVEESGIKRWTDGLLWSPSRIVGNFLVYREINERTSSRGSHNKKPYPCDESPTRAFIRKSSPDQMSGAFRGHSSDQGTFKVGGLVKKTITVTIEGSDLHLISYYTPDDIRSGRLKRPSSRADIMTLYMPPEIFRLTNFRVPPKVERGPDGKPRLVEEEEPEQVECKVEDQGYTIPASPTWSNHSSPSSPMDGYGSNHIYSGQGQGNGCVNGRWTPSQGNPIVGSLHREIASGGWSPTNSALTSNHTMSRRRESSSVQSDSWTSINGRWQNQQHDSTATSQSVGANGAYSDRLRGRSGSQYEDGQVAQRRDNNPNGHTSFPVRYHTPHPTTTRESALQRLHWQPRDAPDQPRDLRRAPGVNGQAGNSFSSSSPVAFTPQGYTTHTYTSSWTPADANIMATPTLHSIANQSPLSYEGTYNSTVPSPEGYANVEDYQDS